MVRRDRSLFVHVFEPAVDRDALIGRRLRSLAEKLCGGSLVPIPSHLARTKSLSAAERKALRELIEGGESGGGVGASGIEGKKGVRDPRGGRGRRG